jgi:LysR family transcriptional regulator, glycine cleavage system transcriptional activator
MRRLLPPTHLLRAFISVVDGGSVARAAETLHLTPSAVSKQVNELEKWLGIVLFERVRQRLAPTPAALSYRASLAPLLQQLEAATRAAIHGDSGNNVLRVFAVPSFREKWLDAKLPDFAARHPQIELHLGQFAHVDAVSLDLPVDAVIRYGRGERRAERCDYLLGREVVVIAPPHELLKQPLATREDIRHHPLIHHAVQPDDWAQWCRLHGLSGVNTEAGPHLVLTQSIISAVRSGLGLALMPLFLVSNEIATGAVSAPFPVDEHEGGGYHWCEYTPAAENLALAAFRRWLLGAADATRLD